ncbi:hypothetical protein E5676_scaffold16G00220 [Cucumis melo var. makuwa]|uniref:Uncharacterized protein n=1 Tax=Cucumis melo var. makuwa TaxID=1194695 RepID=A0A5D3CI05_CUCMM|nr:hypothetical protein E5676_scaffold16G00220 [Cucumis melo var. makuwa]
MRNGCEMSTIDHSLTGYETRCDWVDTKNGVRVDDLGFTLVDLNRIGDKSLHCPAILECPAGMTREDEEISYIKIDCEGTWGIFSSRWTITYQTMTLGKQARLEAGCSSVLSIEGVINKGKGTCGPTWMSKITRVICDGHE